MKKSFKIWIWTGLLLGVINALWLGYNVSRYLDVSNWFVPTVKSVYPVFYGIVVLLFSHIIISLAIVSGLRKVRSTYISGIILLIIGSLSFISIFFDWAGLTDILKEYPQGWNINLELKVIWFCTTLHFTFILSSIIYLLRILRLTNDAKKSQSLIGEQLFISLNIVGIICGIIGLVIIWVDFNFRFNPKSYKWAIIPYCLFVFIPYLIMLTGWIFQAISDKRSGWYDEKQKNDIYKSSVFTLVTSVPVMILFFFLNYQRTDGMMSILWLPFYLFVTLFVFSVFSLYNFKAS